MGNKQFEKFQWQRSYHVLQRNFNDNTLILQKRQGGQQYIGRELMSTDRKQSQEIKRLVKAKYHNNNPFLTKLTEVHYNNDEAYCSPEDKIYLVFEKPKQTLRQEILARKFANEPFTEQQADIILESGAKAIRSLREMAHPHNNISTSSIFIDENRRIMLGDPWITPPIYTLEMSQNVFACPSPQKILLQNDQILSICPYRSDLFSLGTVVLEALNYEHMDVLYEKGFRKLIEARVQERLSKIKNQQLRYKLSIVLSHDPQNREEIYRFYRGSGLGVSGVRNKIVKIGNNASGKQHQANIQRQLVKNSPIAQLSRDTASQININTNNGYQKQVQKSQLTQNAQQIGFGHPPVGLARHQNQTNYTTIYNNPNSSPNTNIYKHNNSNSNNNNRNKSVPKNYTPTMPKINFQSTPHYQPTTPIYPTPNINTNPNFTTNTNPSYYGLNHPTTLLPMTYTPTYSNPISTPITTIPSTTTLTTVNGTLLKENKSGLGNFTHLNIDEKIKESQFKNNFQPVLIKSSDDFVKTSVNIRYLQNSSSKDKDVSVENAQSIAHIGTYAVKPTTYGTVTKTQSYDIPLEQQPPTKKQVRQIPHQPAIPQSTPTGNYFSEQRDTPERKPTRNYNSTIKQEPDQYSYSGSKDGEDEYEYVIEEYEAGRYEGQKKNGMRNGFGKFYYNEGSVYEGHWKDNLMNGKGNLYYSNGKLAYEGDWRMDEFHGFGKVYNEDQLEVKGSYDYSDFSNVNDYWASYQGELNSDRRHGRGKIKFSNGEIFVGNFLADSVEGDGKFYTLNGQIIHGIWKNNKLVKRL